MLRHIFRRRPGHSDQCRSSPPDRLAELEEVARQAEFEAELAGIRASIAAVDADHARIAARAARRRADTAEMVATGVLPEGFDEETPAGPGPAG